MARANTESDDGEGHKCSHKREIKRDAQNAEAREEHESLSVWPPHRVSGEAGRARSRACNAR